jgi:hypothetical protein
MDYLQETKYTIRDQRAANAGTAESVPPDRCISILVDE